MQQKISIYVAIIIFGTDLHQTTDMATRKLAKRLGLLRQRSQSASGLKKSVISNQIFSYLIVIDFESTCWREKNNYGQEIIEFPAVLLNTSSGEVESEFHTYVQPQEHPVLSEFCTELTGITQVQVEAGVPLQICLSRFNRWVQNLQLEKGVMFPKKQQTCSASDASQKLCTFLTWSDWDLAVCLQYECKRKQLYKPDVLCSWIDLRSTYRLFYSRKPKGLNGALQDLGIQFSGREHSGLDDARNTARLAVRMMRDGCVLKITRNLERTPSMAKFLFNKNVPPSGRMQEKQDDARKKANFLNSSKSSSSFNISLKARQKHPLHEEPPSSSSGQTCHSLISPKTLLNITTAPLKGQTDKLATAHVVPRLLLSTVPSNCSSPHGNGSSSHVLFSTTVGCISSLRHQNVVKTSPADEEERDLLVETDERCSSYDDVVLVSDQTETDAVSGGTVGYVSDYDGRCQEWDGLDHSLEAPLVSQHERTENSEVLNNARDSLMVGKSVNSNAEVFNHASEEPHQSTSRQMEKCFAVPKVVNWSKLNGHLRLDTRHKNNQHNRVSPVLPNPFLPENTSTPNPSTMRPKPTTAKHREPLKSSFTIYTDPKTPHPSTSSSLHPPRNILSSLPTNLLSSCAKGLSGALSANGSRVTSPLCTCGRRARRQVVSNGGPNHGRGFYCCPVRRSGAKERGCGFFKWESALMKSSSVAPPAAGSSVSLCQVNSALPYRRPQRKSC
ncbi:ERI1 exoribonuclease 2 [Poeciliopsis prolifica]|uniref:ERI1 exoribonuclease 2 n=1 Tax=Poeciliopsis prolifica TaxID=188132 RepID=UPI00241400A0|nr:ERI1 exoribonuclease 2 [Poeciliopsis prolifica]